MNVNANANERNERNEDVFGGHKCIGNTEKGEKVFLICEMDVAENRHKTNSTAGKETKKIDSWDTGTNTLTQHHDQTCTPK